MSDSLYSQLATDLGQIRKDGLYKEERLIMGEQTADIEVGGKQVLNFCANNYLGLADSADLIVAAKEALDNYCLLYTSPSPRDRQKSRMPSSA